MTASMTSNGGCRIVSIAWIIPFVEKISTRVTLALFTLSTFSRRVTRTMPPESIVGFIVVVVFVVLIEAAVLFPRKRWWYLSILSSVPMLSTLTSSARTPTGNLSKAALLGAKSVNGPVPFRKLPRLAATTACTREVKFKLVAVCTRLVLCCAIKEKPRSSNVNGSSGKSLIYILPVRARAGLGKETSLNLNIVDMKNDKSNEKDYAVQLHPWFLENRSNSKNTQLCFQVAVCLYSLWNYGIFWLTCCVDDEWKHRTIADKSRIEEWKKSIRHKNLIRRHGALVWYVHCACWQLTNRLRGFFTLKNFSSSSRCT